jgi:CheY-like chemotaxis protein
LLVDDEVNLLLLYSIILRKNGHDVSGAVPDGAEAVRAIESDSNSIDVIVMDYSMPRMDGLTATKIIKEINPNIKVILCSAYSDEIATEQESLFDARLRKPISQKDLVDAVGGLSKKAQTYVNAKIFSGRTPIQHS